MKAGTLAALVAAVALSFGGGYWVRSRGPGERRAEPAVAGSALYQCPMHPQIVSDKPGDCPICHMSLQKAEPDSLAPSGDAGPMTAGRASFSLSPDRQQLIGVTTGRAERRDLVAEIRTVGKVAYDPELYNAITEYRAAITARERIKDSSWPEAHERAEALVAAAAMRLRLMGLSGEQISAGGRAASAPENLLLPGELAWVYAQVYEYEADLVRPGQPVEVTAPAAPGAVFRGKVGALDPVLDAATRTLRARVEIPNPQGRLKPEMFVNVRISVALGRRLAVPQEAVLDAGESQVVFVKKGAGEFEPRPVTLGREAGAWTEVLSGLREGSEVVTSANFLIDSESRFKSALGAFQSREKSQTHRH